MGNHNKYQNKLQKWLCIMFIMVSYFYDLEKYSGDGMEKKEIRALA